MCVAVFGQIAESRCEEARFAKSADSSFPCALCTSCNMHRTVPICKITEQSHLTLVAILLPPSVVLPLRFDKAVTAKIIRR